MNIRPHKVAVWAVFAVVCGGYLLMAVKFPVAYIWATYEDLFGEWSQTYLFAAGFVFSFLLAARAGSYRWFFALLSVALFYTVMEEISWGQRIIGFDTPDVFKRYNLQNETNLHNMLVGPFSTLIKDLIEYALAGALVVYGLVFPLLLRANRMPARWLDRIGVAPPPFYLWPFFVTAAWLELAPFHFNEAEIAEILVAFAMMTTAAQYWIVERFDSAVDQSPRWSSSSSRRFTVVIYGTLMAVIALATATTLLSMTDRDRRDRIENRLINGYEKFADRYERYERWDIVVELYSLVHEASPSRTSILRRMASAHRNRGDEENFEVYTRKALNILLKTQARDADKVSNNLSLARTYRLLGDDERAQEHAQRAHEIALERVRVDPESARKAYWLGKTHRYLGDYEEAREQFKTAFDRRPNSKKYRKAYYEMRQATGASVPLK